MTSQKEVEASLCESSLAFPILALIALTKSLQQAPTSKNLYLYLFPFSVSVSVSLHLLARIELLDIPHTYTLRNRAGSSFSMADGSSPKTNFVSSNQQSNPDSPHTMLIGLVLPMIILFLLTTITMAFLYLKKTGILNPIFSPRRRQDPEIVWSFQFPKLHRTSNLAVTELAGCSAILVLKTASCSAGHNETKLSDEKNPELPYQLDIGLRPASPWAPSFFRSSTHVLGQSTLSLSMPKTLDHSDKGTKLFHKRLTLQSRLWKKWHLPSHLRPKSDQTEVYILPPPPAILSDSPYSSRRVTRSG